MTTSLAPATVPPYLATLSVDLRACAVLDASGSVVAGDPALGGRAWALLGGAATGEAVTTGCRPSAAGHLLSARNRRFTVVAEAGPLTLTTVLIEDLERVLRALSSG